MQVTAEFGTLSHAVFCGIGDRAPTPLARIAGLAMTARDVVLARTGARQVDPAIDVAIRSMTDKVAGKGYGAIPAAVLDLEQRIPGFVPLLASTLLGRVETRSGGAPLPDSLIGAFEQQATRILTACMTGDADRWSMSDDPVQKDIALCRLDMFACQAQVVEQHGAWSPRTLMGQPAATLHRAGMMLMAQGFRRRPYYEIHTHTPMLDGFHARGFDNCYLMVADLLTQNPGWLGMIASSWFYDPQLSVISPRLAYLRSVPEAGGALFLRGKTTPKDIELATQTSSMRRALFQSGAYVPVNWTFVWPRRDLLRWADANRATSGVH